MRCALLGFVAEGFQRRVEELVDQPVEGGGDLCLGLGINAAELIEQPGELVGFDFVGAVAR